MPLETCHLIYAMPWATFKGVSIFFDLIEQCLGILMDDFSIYVDSFDYCLTNFEMS